MFYFYEMLAYTLVCAYMRKKSKSKKETKGEVNATFSQENFYFVRLLEKSDARIF